VSDLGEAVAVECEPMQRHHEQAVVNGPTSEHRERGLDASRNDRASSCSASLPE
jgi:hypothetical protein